METSVYSFYSLVLPHDDRDGVLDILAPESEAMDVYTVTTPAAQSPASPERGKTPNVGGYAKTPGAGGYGKAPGTLGQRGRPTTSSLSTTFSQASGQAPFTERGDKVTSPFGMLRRLRALVHGYGEESKGVKYIHDTNERRRKYQVEIAVRMRRRGQVFDTESIKKHFSSKYEVTKKREIGFATLGVSRTGRRFDYPQEWIDKALIWVCAADPESDRPAFYSHVGKIHRFHHSSFLAGGDVIGAGEWIVEQGKLKKISANSGHYRPTIDFLYRSVLHMAGAFQPDTAVFLYDKDGDQWVEYPVRDFIRAPTNGGKYWPHPRAVGT
jgi:hypothetical protein